MIIIIMEMFVYLFVSASSHHFQIVLSNRHIYHTGETKKPVSRIRMILNHRPKNLKTDSKRVLL